MRGLDLMVQKTAKNVRDCPALSSMQTVLGYGVPDKQGTFQAHGSPLGPEEVTRAQQNLGWPVEAGSPLGWERWTGQHGALIAIDRFGASAPGETVFTEYGFTVDHIVRQALALLGR
jgi:transketolase